jgi:hypothetical protein
LESRKASNVTDLHLKGTLDPAPGFEHIVVLPGDQESQGLIFRVRDFDVSASRLLNLVANGRRYVLSELVVAVSAPFFVRHAERL